MRVRIYKPAKSAAQSGRGRSSDWVLEPDLPTPRAPEPLMGWVGAGDTLSTLRNRLRFSEREEAVAFTERNGWAYTLGEPAARSIHPRSYLDNFRIIRPQDEEKQAAADRKAD